MKRYFITLTFFNFIFLQIIQNENTFAVYYCTVTPIYKYNKTATEKQTAKQ